MIKKTTQTLKGNPILFAWFLIPFVYMAITTFLTSQEILSSQTFIQAISYSFVERMDVGAAEYITWFLNVVYYIGWTFLLYPPLVYLVYKIADKQSTQGWYAKGLKHGWWRVAVLTLMTSLAAGVAAIPLMIICVIIGIASMGDPQAIQIVFMVIMIPLMAIMTIYISSGTVSVIAEKDFGKGLGMTFKVGTKHFFRILLVSILSLIPTVATFVIVLRDPNAMNDTYLLISSLWSCIAAPIITTFAMHCYIDIRDKEIEKKALMEQMAVATASEE